MAKKTVAPKIPVGTEVRVLRSNYRVAHAQVGAVGTIEGASGELGNYLVKFDGVASSYHFRDGDLEPTAAG